MEKEIRVETLPSFIGGLELPEGESEQRRAFNSGEVKKVICFVLGQEGTNIIQACRKWVDKAGIVQKTEIVICETPEEAVQRANKVQENGQIAIFWTCAVYCRLHNIFFENPETLSFYIKIDMPLDEMQLATTRDGLGEVNGGIIPSFWKIASHPSPAPLIENIGIEIVLSNSNSNAAKMCAEGKVSACVTTETARKIYNLVTLHVFGSPEMVFFGGITKYSARILSSLPGTRKW